MKQNFKRGILALALLVALAGAQGCKDKDLNTAARAVNSILKTVKVITDTSITAYNQGLLTRDEITPIETLCKKVTLAADQANQTIIKLNALDPATRVNLFSLIDPIFQSFNADELQAIAGIKNPDRRAQFQALFNSIQASLSILDATFAGGTK